MEKTITKMIEQFVKAEKLRALIETEIFSWIHMEEFLTFIHKLKKDRWTMGDITAEDMEKFVSRLESDYVEEDSGYVDQALKTVDRFMDFCVKSGWVASKPWGDIRTLRKEEES